MHSLRYPLTYSLLIGLYMIMASRFYFSSSANIRILFCLVYIKKYLSAFSSSSFRSTVYSAYLSFSRAASSCSTVMFSALTPSSGENDWRLLLWLGLLLADFWATVLDSSSLRKNKDYDVMDCCFLRLVIKLKAELILSLFWAVMVIVSMMACFSSVNCLI